MKESGLEKLIELLNEFETPQSGVVFKSYDNYDGTFYGVDCDGETEIAWSDSMILSKRFQFVERLVENDKIDKGEIPQIDGSYYNLYDDCDNLLMNLSIQDEPIRFLCEILK